MCFSCLTSSWWLPVICWVGLFLQAPADFMVCFFTCSSSQHFEMDLFKQVTCSPVMVCPEGCGWRRDVSHVEMTLRISCQSSPTLSACCLVIYIDYLFKIPTGGPPIKSKLGRTWCWWISQRCYMCFWASMGQYGDTSERRKIKAINLS